MRKFAKHFWVGLIPITAIIYLLMIISYSLYRTHSNLVATDDVPFRCSNCGITINAEHE